MSTPTRTPRKVGAPRRDRQNQGVIVAPEKVDDPKAERVLWDLASQTEGLGGRGSVGGDWLKNPLKWPEGFVIEIDKWRTTAPIRWKVYEKSKRTHGKGVEFWLNDEKIIDAENNITASMVDHGGLGGLADDDHTQYARTDGTRDITGLQDFNSSIRLKQAANTNYLTLAQGADAIRTVTFPDATTTLAGLSLAQTFVAAQSFITPSGTAITIGTDNTTKDIVIGEITGATAYVGIGLRGSLAISGTDQANFYSSSVDSILYINNVNHIAFRINNIDVLTILGSEHVLLKDSRSMLFGTDQDAGFQYNVSQTPDAFLLGVGADSNGLVITKKGNIGTFDFAHALETDPTLFIHDATLSTTAFTKFQHGVLEANVGNLSLTGKGGHVRIRSGANVNYTELRQASDAAASATFPASAITVAGKDIDNAFTVLETFAAGIATDTVAEKTVAAGVTVDGVLLKDGGATLTENLVISALKTIDGRDVSVDGTKLDGIEAGATGDQTAAEILAALITVDGAGSGLDADLLDGLSSAAFAQLAVANTFTEAQIIQKSAAGANFGLKLLNTATDGYSVLWLGGTDAGVYRLGSAVAAYSGANSLMIGTVGAHVLGFLTANVIRATIDATGKVGIGVAAPDELLDVAGKIRFAGSAGGGDATLDFSSASNYTLTLPNVTGTLAALNLAQTFSAVQTFTAASGIRWQDGQASLGGILKLDTITTGDKTYTFPNATGNVALQGLGMWTMFYDMSTGAVQTGTTPLDVSYVLTEWKGAKFQKLREAYFEVYVEKSGIGGAAVVELYNATSASVIATIESAVAAPTRVISGNISSSLTDTFNIKIRIYNSTAGSTCTLWSAKLITVH